MPAIVRPLKILQIAVCKYKDEIEPTIYAVGENGTLYFYDRGMGDEWIWKEIEGPVGLIDVDDAEYREWTAIEDAREAYQHGR